MAPCPLCLWAFAPAVSAAQAGVQKSYQPTKAEEASKKGLAYLFSQQDPQSGAIRGPGPNESAKTALAIMALTAAGGQEVNAGKAYSTAMAVLCLAVKYHYLPIHPR